MSVRRAFAVFSVASLIVALGAARVQKPPKAQPPRANQIAGWTLVTEQLDGDSASGDFSAPTHVTLTRTDGSTIDADRATGNYKRHQAQLFGHVKIHDVSGTFGMRSGANAPHEPATLNCDELRVDGIKRLYDAQGNVHYEQGQTTSDSDSAHLNDIAHKLDLDGKVHLVQGDRTMDTQHATYDTITGDGQATGNVRMEFPGAPVTIATPKPIILKVPGKSQPTPAPSPTP